MEISARLIPPAAIQTPVHSSHGPALPAISIQQFCLTSPPRLPHIPNPVNQNISQNPLPFNPAIRRMLSAIRYPKKFTSHLTNYMV